MVTPDESKQTHAELQRHAEANRDKLKNTETGTETDAQAQTELTTDIITQKDCQKHNYTDTPYTGR